MKNNEKKLLTEILRVQELMGVKQLINEEGGKYEPVVDFFKSMLKTSVKDVKFTKMFDEAFENIKYRNSELFEKLKKSLGTSEISVNGLQGLRNISSIKSSELKAMLEELQSEMISYIFTKYTDDFIEIGDGIIEASLVGKPQAKRVYDFMVDLAQKGEAEQLQIAIQKQRGNFPSYVLDHIQNTKFIQKAEDTVIDAVGQAGDEFVDAAGSVLSDTADSVVKGLKVVGNSLVGLSKILIKGVKILHPETLLDGITKVFPSFNKLTFIRGYKGFVDKGDAVMVELEKEARDLNDRFFKIQSGQGEGDTIQLFEKDLEKYLNKTNKWMLDSQIKIVDYWKTEFKKLSNEKGIDEGIDRFFGKSYDPATRQISYPKLQETMDDVMSLDGKQNKINQQGYISAWKGFTRMFTGLKSVKNGGDTWGQLIQRWSKFITYGEPRLFVETADNIVYKQGLKGYWGTEVKRRLLFAFIYWNGIYNAFDFWRAYNVGTQNKDSFWYKASMKLGGPNTKYPTTREGDDKGDMFLRWLGMATVNYFSINSQKLTNGTFGDIFNIKGDKEWENLNTPSAETLKMTDPTLAQETLNRRGNLYSKFFSSILYEIWDNLDYRNIGNAQSKLEAAQKHVPEIIIQDIKMDPNYQKMDTAQQKILIDSVRKATDEAQMETLKYRDSISADFN